jgi:hypothetical protein
MSIPDDLDEVCAKLLEKKPEDRYQTADEVRELVTRCRKSLSESTARSIGLSIGRAIPKSGLHPASPATPPSQPLSSATPYGTPTPMEVQPPPPPADMTRIKGETAEVPKVDAKKKLPPEMVAATQAIPEGSRYKGGEAPAPKSGRGLMLGVIGLLLGVAALGVAFFTRQPATQPAPVPPPAKVEAPKPQEPTPEPAKAEAPKPEPLPEPAKSEAPKPETPEPAKAEAPRPAPPEPKKAEPAKAEAPKPEPKKAEPAKTPGVAAAPAKAAPAPSVKGDKLLTRFLSLDKQAAAKPDAVPNVERTILGKYIDAMKSGTIKPEQREQAEGFANHVEAELKGQ